MLYWESSRGTDEFYYILIEFSDKYFEEAKDLYKRQIVSKIYKHPDELFDAHSYEKAGCVLHMIRKQIGDIHFRAALKTYLERYKNSSAESNNFLEILEGVCGKDMHQFFDQWVYGKGHPELEIEISTEQDNNCDGKGSGNDGNGIDSEGNKRKLKLKIKQTQEDNEKKEPDESNSSSGKNIFEFNLDVKVVFSGNNNGEGTQEKHVIHISEKTTESSIDIPPEAKIDAISIDPEFKILKKVKSIKIPNETKEFQLKGLLVNQLRNGKTIVERIDAARMLQNLYSDDVVVALQNAVLGDKFYGVSIEAADALGSFYDKSNYEKSETAYQALRVCLTSKALFSDAHTRIKRAVIKNIGIFEREDSIDLLEPFATGNGVNQVDGESDFIKSAAAVAIGKSSKRILSPSPSSPSDKKRLVIPLLKNLAQSANTFQNVVATGAIDGLKELASKNGDEAVVLDIADFLIENTFIDKDYFIRSKATSALGKFLCTNCNNKKASLKMDNLNQRVFSRLMELLKDNRRRIKINACLALADDDAKFDSAPDMRIFDSIDALIYVAEHDLDGFVRRNAEASVNVLREWVKEWSSKAPTIGIKIRET
jgi:aminopeptidase N